MKPRAIGALAAFLVSAAWGCSADVTATGLTLPFFDDAGKLTHRLVAKRASVTGTIRHIEEIEISYFSPLTEDRVIQRLQATEATWDEVKGTLTGSGTVSVKTEENQLSGEGFVFSLASSVLEIRRDFRLTDPEFVLTSDRATIHLEIEKNGDELRVRDANRCEASGHLHVVADATARSKYRFDDAFSERAIYDGPRRVITFPNEVRFLTNGSESTSQTVEIKLNRPPAKG